MAEEQIENLGAAIQRVREAKSPKMSRAKLAREIPVDPKTIERWERGTSGGAHDSLGPIADALGTTVDALLAEAITIGRDRRGENGAATLPGAGDGEEGAVALLRQELVGLRSELLGEIGKVRKAQEAQQSKPKPGSRKRATTRK